MTECNQSQFEFEAHFSRRVVAEFSGERLTTEGGALLLRAADRKMGLLRRVVRCFRDARDPQRIDKRRGRSCWTWTPPTRRCTDGRKRVFFTATTDTTATCRYTCSAAIICCACGCGPRTSTPARGVSKKYNASCGRFARSGRRPASSCERTPAFAAKSCWRGAKTTRWTMYLALRATSACGGSSVAPCSKPNKNTGAREKRRGCSASSLIAPRKAGRGHGG